MMKQKYAVEVLREIRDLEARAAAIRRASSPEAWRYVLVAIADRVAWCRYCLSLEHPAVISMAGELLLAQDERAAAGLEPAPEAIPDPPANSRVH